MPLVTRMFASSEQACEPMASSSVNSSRKTRAVPLLFPGEAEVLALVLLWGVDVFRPAGVAAAGDAEESFLGRPSFLPEPDAGVMAALPLDFVGGVAFAADDSLDFTDRTGSSSSKSKTLLPPPRSLPRLVPAPAQ